ncbi:MAG: gamma-glutamyltransferase [Bacteroidetes bacterium]|nr:gamma-glutamyltransferase [Rhodothermaceae bacterium RA]RMH49887.1 MAG: gamma-glutamyltransferase [Bacteroidota bacterium]
MVRLPLLLLAAGMACGLCAPPVQAQRPNKPVLHGRHWVAITGKPLAATAGAAIFQQGGNAVDAACAMLAATATMWDVLGWGGETQALIYNPNTGKVIGVNALGVAPTGATADFFRAQGLAYPPEYGPLAAVTPGTPGGLLVMLAEFGTMRLAEVLAPAMEMAEGYPIEAQTADAIEREKERIKQWTHSKAVFLPHLGEPEREAPYPGELFRQPDLLATLQKLVDAEAQALAEGKSRKEAIYAAYDRFYRGDIAEELVRGTRAEGGLLTMDDLDRWQVYLEEPVMTTYKDIEVYKLTSWVQGPVMLQMLNMLETFDLPAMGYNSARYIHTLYQVMNLAFADRDFYYGDPYFPPEEPLEGLLSKDYARARVRQIDPARNDPNVKPGDPYPFQGQENPYLHYLENWSVVTPARQDDAAFDADFYAGTTSIQAADAAGWVVSVTPSGGWIPAFIAGETGIGLSQRMQSFVLDPAENPFNVVEPGKRPRATLTPGLALKDGRPYLSFAVQGGDSQDQNLLQFFLNVVEFGMDVQEAAEAANINSFQLKGSFGQHESRPGRLLLREDVPGWVRAELEAMGYDLTFEERTSGPINAIFFDHEHGTMWGGSSDHGEDYGIAW